MEPRREVRCADFSRDVTSRGAEPGPPPASPPPPPAPLPERRAAALQLRAEVRVMTARYLTVTFSYNTNISTTVVITHLQPPHSSLCRAADWTVSLPANPNITESTHSLTPPLLPFKSDQRFSGMFSWLTPAAPLQKDTNAFPPSRSLV